MQIVYFPYITLKDVDEIAFPDLNAVVWNFDRKAEDYIPDKATRDHIRRILDMNIRGRLQVRNIGILSIGDTDFRSLGNEMNIADEVRLRLFLSFAASNNVLKRHTNAGLSIGTAENFSFVIQNFQTGDDHIAESAGAIVIQTAGATLLMNLSFKHQAMYLHLCSFVLIALC